MQLIVLLYLCGCAIAEEALQQQFKKTPNSLDVLNKSEKISEETKAKTEKHNTLDESGLLNNYANDEPFRPIISPFYDQYQSASSTITQSTYDKNEPNELNNKQQGTIYRGPYSPDVYQQQYKQTQKNGSFGNVQQNTQYAATQNVTPQPERNYQSQPEQQTYLQQQPQTNKAMPEQQQKIQYVIAIPMSYLRQLLQQQQQQPHQPHQPYYPAPALPPQPLPASQIAATPAFTALIAQRPLDRSPQPPAKDMAPAPTASTQGYTAPPIPIPLPIPMPINNIFATAAQDGLAYQAPSVYRPVYHQQIQVPQTHLFEHLTQYQIYQPAQSLKSPPIIYGQLPGQNTAGTVPIRLIQAPITIGYTPQSNHGVALAAPQQVAASQQVPTIKAQLQQSQMQQKPNLPFISYATPVLVQRVNLQQQPQQNVLNQLAEENHDASFIRVPTSANALSPNKLTSQPTYFYPITPSVYTTPSTYVGNLLPTNNKVTPFTNFIVQPYSGNSPYTSTKVNEHSGGPPFSSVHYGTHLYHPPPNEILTRSKETLTKGNTNNSNKQLYNVNNSNVSPTGLPNGPQKTGTAANSPLMKYS